MVPIYPVTWTFSENIPQLKTDIAVLEEFSRHLFLEVRNVT